MLKHRHISGLVGTCILFVMVSLRLAGTSYASAPQQDQERPIRVVTKVVEPFVIKDNERLTGFSIVLWKEISLLTGISFELIEVQTVGEQLDALRNGDADIAIAAISMTPEREEDLDFSYPIYLAGLQIMTTGKPKSTLGSMLDFLFSSRFLIGFAFIFAIMVVVGRVVWFVERHRNPDFPQSYVKGIWEGLWWAAATVTTVGYGDIIVKDKWGRLIGLFWMFAGLFLIANFTAFVTAEVTVSHLETSISDIEDLRGKRVVTLSGTTSAEFLNNLSIPFSGVTTIDEAYTQLENDQADAIVYDAPVLQYYVATANRSSFELVGEPFKTEYYGIALQPDSPYEEILNKALLEIRANGIHKELLTKWYLSNPS